MKGYYYIGYLYKEIDRSYYMNIYMRGKYIYLFRADYKTYKPIEPIKRLARFNSGKELNQYMEVEKLRGFIGYDDRNKN